MNRLIDIGFIGLGNMGRPMAARLAEAGFNLTVGGCPIGIAGRFRSYGHRLLAGRNRQGKTCLR